MADSIEFTGHAVAAPHRMPKTGPPHWLNWARSLQALAQTGLTYAQNPFDRERYHKLHELAVEMFATCTGENLATIEGWFAVQPGYATPKVDVRGACFREDKILMVQERSDLRWCLPGGWADVGDVPSQAAEREVREESGFECVARKVIGVYDANRGGEPFSAFHAFKIIFLCEITPDPQAPQGWLRQSGVTGGRPQSDSEIVGVDFFARDVIPPLSTHRTTAAWLAECFAHHDDPARRTAFD